MLVFRDEVVVAQQDLMAGFHKWTGFVDSRHDKVLIGCDCLVPARAELAEEPVAFKPAWRRRMPQKKAMAAPRPFFGRDNHFRPQGVQDDVPTQFEKITFLLHQDGFVPSLKQMSNRMVAPVEMLSIFTIELAHRLSQIRLDSLNHQMEMVGHQAKAVYHAVMARAHQG